MRRTKTIDKDDLAIQTFRGPPQAREPLRDHGGDGRRCYQSSVSGSRTSLVLELDVVGGRRGWNSEPHSGTTTDIVLRSHASIMSVDDTAGDREPHAHAAAF